MFCLQFFRSVQSTCTDLLKVIEKYQQRIIRESKTSWQGLFVVHFMLNILKGIRAVFKCVWYEEIT